jgi:hypothetical protein
VAQRDDFDIPAEQEQLYERTETLLRALARRTEARVAVVLVLLREDLPAVHTALRDAGLPFGACGTTQKILEYANSYTRRSTFDREERDFHLKPLVEIGVLERCQVPNAKYRRENEVLLVSGWPGGNNNQYSGYRVTDEARELLCCPEDEWQERVERFVSETPKRQELVKTALAQAEVPSDSAHSQLIRVAVQAQITDLAEQGREFECIYIDDAGGTRLPERFRPRLEDLGLVLDGNSPYPDGLLADPDARELWVLDAVTSDGEVDELRAGEFVRTFATRGWAVAGFTTAYATFQDMVARQAKWGNLATNTNVWVAQDGGRFYAVGRSRRYGN